jgi:hypothetical protein
LWEIVVNEEFELTQGDVRSSRGYTVRVQGRSAIRYADSNGKIDIDAEMQGVGLNAMIWRTSLAQQTRDVDTVIENVRRALGALGGNLEVD